MSLRATFDTSEIADASERFEYWHDAVCSQFVSADSSAINRDAFGASLVTRQIGALCVSEMRAPPHFWSREPKHVRSDEHDELLLSVMLEGTGHLEQNGRSAEQRPGDILLYDTTRPFAYDLGSQVLFLKIPRGLLASRVASIANATAVVLSRDQPIGALVVEAMQQLSKVEFPGNSEAIAGPKLASAVLDLVAVLIDLRSGEQSEVGARQVSQFERIQRYVASNLGDHGLSNERMAACGAMSARTLNRMFAKMGTTPMRWVWQQRLEASHSALTEGRAKSVTEVAFQFGFSELAHFSRSFKAKFGVSPEEVLRSRRRGK